MTNTAHHQGRVPDKVSTIIAALRSGIGSNQMMAYLVEMAVRLVELHRVLKPTGSLYLHCDPTASHYLKLVLDSIFRPDRFQAEIVWKRTSSHNDPKRPGRIHDVLLFYGKTERRTWNKVYGPLDPGYVEKVYQYEDEGGRYRLGDLTGPGVSKGVTGQPWRGIDPTSFGRHWRRPPNEMEELLQQGRIKLKANGVPSLNGYKLYLKDSPGMALQSIWTDIPNVTGISSEKLGWQTQKPIALLERIIEASSSPGDIVLDPFCGCGTALVAAEKLGRRWIGIDITYLSIAVMKARLKDHFRVDAQVLGQPTEVDGARQLAQSPEGRYQFQWWALNQINARPLGGIEKKGSDRGVDGRVTFTIGPGGEMGQALVSVKSGHVTSAQVRDLKGTIEREKAEIGLFITLEEPSREMELEATTAGYYTSPIDGRDYPRIQILTIRQLLEEHRKPLLPLLILSPYQQAERIPTKKAAEQQEMFG